MIRSLIITDTETTGLDPAKDRCIEVAIAVYDVPSACVVESFSSLLQAHENAAEAINRIPLAALEHAPPPETVWAQLAMVADRTERMGRAVFVAHRAEFDRSFYPKHIADALPWVCSKFDIEWPLSKLGDHLVNVALAHGVPVHDNHRASTDVGLLRMCREILTTGDVVVKRPDREELIAIRNGAWSYERLVEWAEHEDAALEALAKTSTALPHSPDRAALDNLCQELVQESLR